MRMKVCKQQIPICIKLGFCAIRRNNHYRNSVSPSNYFREIPDVNISCCISSILQRDSLHGIAVLRSNLEPTWNQLVPNRNRLNYEISVPSQHDGQMSSKERGQAHHLRQRDASPSKEETAELISLTKYHPAGPDEIRKRGM